jgi:hypothetical protein
MVFGTSFAASLGADVGNVRNALWFMESRFGSEVSLDELSQVAGISRYHFVQYETIKAWWKRIFERIRETLIVERRRQLDDVEQPTNARNPIEVYSPIFRWLCGRD